MALLPFGSAPAPSPQGYTYFYVIATKTLNIPDNFSNFCFSIMTVDGVFQITGQAIIL